ncbi:MULTISPECIES: ProQ/FINO family protein [spotted fever group]|uniref:ProP expression regulator n=1 Tax=Rickettsia tamurae subsp. buchneri TaxID=1462938 RepID=A0A8E1BZC0_9RICK|nr:MULTISPECIES: ProQ/FINO family protein [spotted fever group]EER20902.1 ProP osmoprotectant transporter [Rickettsia endosymbiont of Ixodes scapularis]KDO02256.1 ProP expression regulator [Rickettsia tamurae subsp. buchneri]
MQTARSTLKLKMPLPLQTVAPVLPQKQVVVIDKNTLQQKNNNSKPTQSVKPNACNNKAAKTQTLTDQQQEALKAKLARWKEEYKNTLALLQAKYPLCFSIPAKRLAIGIHKEIIAAENGNVSKMQIRRFFKKYCSDNRYKKLLIEGKQRFNLDGTPASLVTKEEVPPKTNKFFKPKKL